MSEPLYTYAVGQRWVVTRYLYGTDRHSIGIVERVTPQGRAWIGNRLFERGGKERGDRSVSLEPVTNDLLEKIQTANRRAYVENWFRRSKLTNEQVEVLWPMCRAWDGKSPDA